MARLPSRSSPPTLNFSGKQIEVEELSVELHFARKPRSFDEVDSYGNYKVLMTETREKSPEEFDAFSQTLLKSHECLQAKVAARVTVFCALRSKHRGASKSTSTPKVLTMRDMLRVWGTYELLRHKQSTSMALITMHCAYWETANHWHETWASTLYPSVAR